jgi:O-antigen/teichoic acid export membrane protein
LSDSTLSVDRPRAKKVVDLSLQVSFSVLIRQILAYVPAQLIPGLVNFLALALYTRLLSAEAYGRYAFVLAVMVIVKMVAFEWLRMGLFRFFQGAQRDKRLPVLLSTTMAGFVITCSLVSLAWVAILSFVPVDEALRAALWLGLPLLLVWALFEQILQMHRAALAPMRYGLLVASRVVLSLIAALSLIIFLNQGEQGLLLGLIFGTAVAVLMGSRHWIIQITPRLVERALAVDLLRYGMPFTVAFALGLIVSTSDRLLLEYFLGAEALGLYAVGYDLANYTLMTLFVVVNLAAYPLVVRTLEQAGEDAARGQLHQYSIVLFALMLPASVGLALIAQPLSTIMLGEAFKQVAGQLMPWIALSTFLYGIKAFYFDLAFQLGLRTDLQIWAAAAAAALSIVLNLWWIPIYGLMGAVYATVAAYALALVISLGLGRKVFPLPFPTSELSRVVLVTLFIAVVLLLVPRGGGGWLRLSTMVGLGAAAYITAIWFADVGQVRRHLAFTLRQLVSAFKEKPR